MKLERLSISASEEVPLHGTLLRGSLFSIFQSFFCLKYSLM